MQIRENKEGALREEKPFASGMNFYKLFWVFFLGCIAGVIVETLWCLFREHMIENRSGVIYGPFNPVYGFGALIMTVCLHKLSKKRDIWIFFGSMVLGGAFEYVCSLFQEIVMGTISWDYSGMALEFGGRTSLLYSFFWGILGLFWIKDLYPRLSRLIEKIPNKVGKPLTWVLCVFMIFNMAISSLAVMRQTERHEGVPAEDPVREFLDRHYTDEFLAKIYPNMIFVEKESK